MLLGFGDYSKDQVKWAQQALNAMGFNVGTVDGVVGPNTRAGTLAYQKARGLAADGIIGPVTMASIQQDVAVGMALPAIMTAYPSTSSTQPRTTQGSYSQVQSVVLPSGGTVPATLTTALDEPRVVKASMLDGPSLLLYGAVGALGLVGYSFFRDARGGSGGRRKSRRSGGRARRRSSSRRRSPRRRR